MAGKLPAFQFYPADWRKDIGVQSLSLEYRAIWLEMLCIMHESETRGRLILNGNPMSDEMVARLVGVDKSKYLKAKAKILEMGVASQEDGVIYNRRMVRDTQLINIRREAGSKGGNPELTENYNTEGFLYFIKNTKSGAIKIGISINPQRRLYKIRQQFKGQQIELLGVLKVDDMGASEKEWHNKFNDYKAGEWFSLPQEGLDLIELTLKGESKGIHNHYTTPSSSFSSSISSSDIEEKGDAPPNPHPSDLETQKEEKEKKSSAKRKEAAPLDYTFMDTPENEVLKPAFRKWVRYKKSEFNKEYKSQESLEAAFNKLKKYSGGNADKAMEVVDNALAGQWMGIRPLEEPKQYSSPVQQHPLKVPTLTGVVKH